MNEQAAHQEKPEAQVLNLNLGQLRPYEHNPRSIRNAKYDELKQNIKEKRRLLTKLTVTQRPGEDFFIMYAGGNTRLEILNELYSETGDDCFYWQFCFFEPWQSEQDTLIAHLIENAFRQDLAFIDKARAIMKLKESLEKDRGDSLDYKEFSRILSEKKLDGIGVHRNKLYRYHFALLVLDPVLPKALEAGMSGNQVQELIKIYRAYKEYLMSKSLSDLIDPIFANAMVENDDEEFELKAAQKTLERLVSNATGCPICQVRLEIDTLLFGNSDCELLTEEMQPPHSLIDIANQSVNQESSEGQVLKSTDVNNAQKSSSAPTRIPDHLREDESINAGENDFSNLATQPGNQKLAVVPKTSTLQSLQTSPDVKPTMSDLPVKRQECRGLAEKFIDSLSIYIPLTSWDYGYGFYIDLPNSSIQSEIQYNLFWFMVSLSEQNASSERMKLAKDMRFAQYLLEGKEKMAFNIVGPPASMEDLGRLLFYSGKVENGSLMLLFQLITECRLIRAQYRESDIWECLTIEQIKLHNQVKAAGGIAQT